jgi:hypothetical protein
VRTIPSVWRGKPEEKDMPEFKELKLDNVTVYVHNSLDEFGQLEVAVEKSFTGRNLVLRGLPQENNNCCG